MRQSIGGESAKKVVLHGLERLLVALVIIELVFLPWAMGGMRIWSQFTFSGIALLTFIVAILPRNYTEENSRAGRHHLSIWPRLVKFPLFWLGGILMIYMAAQGLNPAWRYVVSSFGWWMESMPHIKWLPDVTA